MLQLINFGAQLQSACEALYHARVTIEDCASRGESGDFVAINVDMVSCFDTVERQTMLDS